ALLLADRSLEGGRVGRRVVVFRAAGGTGRAADAGNLGRTRGGVGAAEVVHVVRFGTETVHRLDDGARSRDAAQAFKNLQADVGVHVVDRTLLTKRGVRGLGRGHDERDVTTDAGSRVQQQILELGRP